MPKISEQLRKANTANIVKKAKRGKTLTTAEIAAVEEFENLQEAVESDKTGNYLLVGSKEAAQFFGVTERSFFRWVAAGMPKEAKGIYDLKKCFLWWKENINNVSTEKEKEVRLRYWKAKADAEEIKIEKVKGELISKENVFSEFAQRCSDLKTTMRAFKYRLSSVLEGKNREEIMQIIGNEIDEMLRGFCRNGSFAVKEVKKGKKKKAEK